MSELLTEFSKKLADRWLTALLLPGLLIVAAAMCAIVLGHRDAFGLPRLATELQGLGDTLQPQPAAVILATVSALLTATAAGMAAQALGVVVHNLLVSAHPRWLVRRLRHYTTEVSQAANHPPAAYQPARLTPTGDRFRLIGQRINVQYGLAVTLTWPRLWLLIPDSVRAPLVASNTSYRKATILTGWGLLYSALGVLWWPAAVAGVVTILISYRRVATSAAVLADLIESAVDIYQQPLAAAVGISLPHGRVTPNEGVQINNILNKRA